MLAISHDREVDEDAYHHVLLQQDGVLTLAQLRSCGLAKHDVERMLRRRELVRVHPGVYVDHTGALTWVQRAWAAVLWAAPAALSHQSAVRIDDALRGRDGAADQREPIHVTIAHHRRLPDVSGVVVHRSRHLAGRVQRLSPPRIRLEDALLDLAAAARTDLDAVAVLLDACGARRTTPARLLAAAEARPLLVRRPRIVAVLRDAVDGTCSTLEQVYLDKVARAHGLPIGERQASHRHGGDRRYRDVLLALYLLVIELDGRFVHDTAAARDTDLERDLDAIAVDELLTVRLSWGQADTRACHTAGRLGSILQRRGWDGAPTRCPCCPT